jgi:hypothetical protein
MNILRKVLIRWKLRKREAIRSRGPQAVAIQQSIHFLAVVKVLSDRSQGFCDIVGNVGFN